MTIFLESEATPNQAVAEYLKNLGALKRTQADAHLYLASVWDGMLKNLTADTDAWHQETLGKWAGDPLTNRDYRAPGTDTHDGSGLHGLELKPLALEEYLRPAAAEKLAQALRIRATDGRTSHRIDGDRIQIEVTVNSQPMKRFLFGLPEYKDLAATIREKRGDAYSIEPEPSVNNARIFFATVPLSLRSVGEDVTSALDGLYHIVRVTARTLRP